jgi:hypothetical protein
MPGDISYAQIAYIRLKVIKNNTENPECGRERPYSTQLHIAETVGNNSHKDSLNSFTQRNKSKF